MKRDNQFSANRALTIFGADFAEGSIAARFAQPALNEIRSAWTQGCDTRSKILADETRTEKGKELASRQGFEKPCTHALKVADRRLDSIKSAVAELRATSEKTLVGPNDPRTVAQEVEARAIVRGKKGSERFSMVQQATASGNYDLGRAVASAQGYLSGLTQEQHTALLNQYLDAAAPKERADIRELEAAGDKIYEAGQRLMENIREGFDNAELDKVEAAQTAANAATAA